MKDIKLALYYERVSTLHVEQDESMENQRALAESYLRRHPEIKLAEPLDTYSERESGKSDTRPKYQQLLQRLSQGDIRYLLIKDFKRLNRSVELSAQLRNHAKEYNYQFILLSTGQVYNPNANEQRMLYNFEAIVNEEVVHRQSEYGRLAHRQKCEAKRLNRNNLTFGFKWDETINDIVIDKEKADIVCELFYRYVFQDQGITELRKFLCSVGLHYSANTVTKWLQETAYIGVFHINKKGSELGVGAGKKTKRYTNPKEEWIAVERPDLTILDKEVFDLAQRIRESRRQHYEPAKNGVVQARFRGTHLFSAKIYCAECGYPFVHGYADRNRTIHIYRDAFHTRTKNPLETCANKDYKRIYEEDLIHIVTNVINSVVQEQHSYFPLLLNILEKVIQEDTSQQTLILEKEQAMKRLKKEADKIMETFTYATGALLTDLNERYNNIKTQVNSLNNEIQNLQKESNTQLKISTRLAKIQEVIKSWETISPDMLTRKMVDAFINKIIIHKEGTIEVILNTNKTTPIFIQNNTKKENLSSGSPFSYSNKSEFQLSTYKRIIENIQRQFYNKKKFQVYLPFFSFTYIESARTNPKTFVIQIEFKLSN